MCFKKTAFMILALSLSLLIVVGCVSAAARSTDTPLAAFGRGAVDLSEQLDGFRRKQAKISYTLMPTLTEKYEEKEIHVEATQLIDLLLADPVYFATYPNNAGETGVTAHIDGDNFGSFVHMVMQTDHTVYLRFNQENYRSVSEKLYEKTIELAKVQNFDEEDLLGVQSVKISHKKKNGKIKTFVITDKGKIDKLVRLMYSAGYGQSHECFSAPDVKVTFQKDDGEVVCHLYSKPVGDVDCDVVVNRLTFYQGYAFVEYIRSLLK